MLAILGLDCDNKVDDVMKYVKSLIDPAPWNKYTKVVTDYKKWACSKELDLKGYIMVRSFYWAGKLMSPKM